MAVSPRPRVTVEEWLNFPEEEGFRTELIRGEVVVSAEASKRHQLISTRLIAAFQNYTDEHGGARAYPPVNLVASEDSGLAPDLILVLDGQDDPDDLIAFRSPPALVVEIVSDSRRDLVVKKEIYEAFGVPEYWALIPDADRVEVYILDHGRYAKPRIVEPGETLSPQSLPGLAIDVAHLFRR